MIFLNSFHLLITAFFPAFLERLVLIPKLFDFFSNYLVDRKIWYFWNDFSSSLFNTDVSIGQGSVLSPILSALYLALFLYIFEKHIKNLKIPVSILLFVDNGLLIAQSKSFSLSNTLLFSSYNIASNLLSKFGLIIEHSKTKIFHFSRSYETFNPPPLNLFSLGGPILHSKKTWRYLEFIFDKNLSFQQYIDFYANKIMSTVKYMKILGNSTLRSYSASKTFSL